MMKHSAGDQRGPDLPQRLLPAIADQCAGNAAAANTAPAQQAAAQGQQRFSDEQLEAMLAPIALYPDNLVTQVLMASTYPLDIVAALRWLGEGNNKSLKGTALEQALHPLPWDPSVKSLVPFPVVLATMNEHLDWTQQMGYAMTIQQSDVFAAIQRLRAKAQTSGHLKSNEYVQDRVPAVAAAAARRAGAAAAVPAARTSSSSRPIRRWSRCRTTIRRSSTATGAIRRRRPTTRRRRSTRATTPATSPARRWRPGLMWGAGVAVAGGPLGLGEPQLGLGGYGG